MAKIKLFSGMDFSGKSTIIKNIDAAMPGVFKIQKKFLTPIDTIEKVRNTWLPAEEWKPLLQSTIEKDIEDYKENGLILQDSLWIIKYIATKLEKDDPEDYDEIKKLKELFKQYPDMDSFYITTTLEERVMRYRMRESSGGNITGSDKILLDGEKFEKIEKYCKNIVLERFPNTIIIDTTYNTPEEIVQNIIQNENFLKDL